MARRLRKEVRVALVGAGDAADALYGPSLMEMDDVTVTAVCDPALDKAEETARKLGVEKVYADYRVMLAEAAPDAVYLLLPPHRAFDVAVAAMQETRHVYFERPPGPNAFQTRRLAECAVRNKVVAMCGFQRRYVPLIAVMKDEVEKRGPIHTAVATYVKCQYSAPADCDGAADVLSCEAVDAVDALRHLCGGEVVKAASDVRALGADDANAFYAILKFSTGATGILQANWACGRRSYKVEMHGQGLSAYAEPDEGGVIYMDGKHEGKKFDPAQCACSQKPWRRLGYFDASRHFIDCVKSGKQPSSSLADAAKTMELVDLIYHSQV